MVSTAVFVVSDSFNSACIMGTCLRDMLLRQFSGSGVFWAHALLNGCGFKGYVDVKKPRSSFWIFVILSWSPL